jgi:hypothetical protein
MPSGTEFPREIRRLLVYHCLLLDSTVDFVCENLFIPDEVERRTIQKLFQRIPSMSPEECEDYVEGRRDYHGASRQLLPDNSEALNYLEELLSVSRSVKMRVLTKQFHTEFFPEYCAHLPSVSTVYRAVRLHNSRKHVDWTHIKKNPIQQIEFLRAIAHISEELIVDIDGMVQTAEDFYNKYGWSPIGEECHRPQINIGGQRYAVHAAFTQLGFIHHAVFIQNVTDEEVREFVNSLRDKLPANAFGLFDNASNQRTPNVRETIEEVFGGRYMYCSPYSPELKPIERGFALVKAYIRERDQLLQYADNHMALINEAFTYYSIGNPGGLDVYNLFRVYKENHQEYNDAI